MLKARPDKSPLPQDDQYITSGHFYCSKKITRPHKFGSAARLSGHAHTDGNPRSAHGALTPPARGRLRIASASKRLRTRTISQWLPVACGPRETETAVRDGRVGAAPMRPALGRASAGRVTVSSHHRAASVEATITKASPRHHSRGVQARSRTIPLQKICCCHALLPDSRLDCERTTAL